MRIQIDHIAKIEGHASFVADIIKGDVKKARLDVREGARLIEGILIGRNYEEAPTISSRICGVCPVVHNLTAIKALESALSVKPSPQTILLRKLLMLGQLINSHCAHLFFFSLSDFFGIKDDLNLIKKYPRLAKDTLKIRNFGNKIIEVVGGRSIHPLSPRVNGFRKLPDPKKLEELLKENMNLYDAAAKFAAFFAKLKYPVFNRKVRYVSLSSPKEYAIYEGDIKTSPVKNEISTGLSSVKDFIEQINEFQLADSAVKSTKFKEETFMVGALARLNNNYKNLNLKAKKILKQSKLKLPCLNPFYNIFGQAIEIMHCLEESEKILKTILREGLKEENGQALLRQGYGGQGMGAIEAPRGTLYYYFETDSQGLIKNCNIITPTAQNLSRLEDDFKEYLPQIQKLSPNQQKEKIKMLIRAYDPCLTCATH